MAFDGNGNFNRLYNWTTDAGAGIKIRADRMDGEDSGFATGLSNCVTKDGQTTITGNLKMSGFRHTGAGAAQARTDYATYGQVQDGSSGWGGTAGGTANAITFSLTPAITAYAAGQAYSFKASAANTGATTVNINGVGAQTIKKNGGADDLNAGDILNGQVIDIFYDGTNFQLIGVPAIAGYYLKQVVWNAQFFS